MLPSTVSGDWTMISSLVRNVERSYEKPFAVLFISAACSMILDDITKALTPPFSGKENWRRCRPCFD